MILEILAPTPGESITEVQVANWLVSNNDYVEKDTELAEIDSDKTTLTVVAEQAGKIQIQIPTGETVKVGTVIATIDTAAENTNKQTPEKQKNTVAEPLSTFSNLSQTSQMINDTDETQKKPTTEKEEVKVTPLARKLMEEKNMSYRQLMQQMGQTRVTRKMMHEISSDFVDATTLSAAMFSREVERKKMSMLRVKLAERLVSVKNETAMLTTFNEVNMKAIIDLKKQYNDLFKEKHGIGIGFMSFFTKAVTVALRHFPQVNSMIDGQELVMHKYADIGVAVSAPKGLVVPVIRNAESLSLAQIETTIKELAAKARDNKLSLDEMQGGTFTITNGGVFGSLMSTPIINPPQSAILGMHNIVERPIAQNGQVIIAPMMYIALSYDHRVIDGRESVGFLVKVKEILENPIKMLFEGSDPYKKLLGL